MQIERSNDWITLKVHMKGHVETAILKYLPEIARTGEVPGDVLQGAKLRRALDELEVDEGEGPLTKDQKLFQKIVGDLRWMCRRIYRIVNGAHKLACVAHRAKCPKALDAAYGMLVAAWQAREEGQTYHFDADEETFSGVVKGTVDPRRKTSIKKADVQAMKETGAPANLQGISDATWSRMGCDMYAMALTVRGAGVLLERKKSPVIAGSSAEMEGLALLKLSDKAIWARIAGEKIGFDMSLPTTLLCDAEAALRAAMGEASVARLRHTMRRAAIVRQRVAEEEIALAHVPDAANVVDIFTKWCKEEKVEQMLAYLNGTTRAREGFVAMLTSLATYWADLDEEEPLDEGYGSWA